MGAGALGVYAGPTDVGEPGAQSNRARDDMATPIRLLLYGDSLFAGYGFDRLDDAFLGQLQGALDAAGYAVRVLPGSVSGDTTRGGVSRLGWTLAEPPDAAIVALGANDMLRGLPADQMQENLARIVTAFQAAGVEVLLCGLPPLGNFGAETQFAYSNVFATLAEAHEVALHPDLLTGVAGEPTLNQADGIHPNADGVARMVEAILPAVEALLASVAGPAS